MKNSLRIALTLAATALPLVAAKAQTPAPKPVLKPTAIPDIKPLGQQIGDRYRLVMSFTPDTVEEGDYGNQETYGTLKIDGITYWQMLRANASKGEQTIIPFFIANNTPETWADDGVSFTKPNKFNQSRKFEFDALFNDKPGAVLNIEVRLYDADGDLKKATHQEVDDLYGKYDEKIDLSKGAGNYWWFWDDGKGNKSRFFVRVEHVKKLYGSDAAVPKAPEIKVIEKPKVPARIPGGPNKNTPR